MNLTKTELVSSAHLLPRSMAADLSLFSVPLTNLHQGNVGIGPSHLHAQCDASAPCLPTVIANEGAGVSSEVLTGGHRGPVSDAYGAELRQRGGRGPEV